MDTPNTHPEVFVFVHERRLSASLSSRRPSSAVKNSPCIDTNDVARLLDHRGATYGTTGIAHVQSASSAAADVPAPSDNPDASPDNAPQRNNDRRFNLLTISSR